MADPNRPNSLKLKFIWFNSYGKPHSETGYYPDKIEFPYDEKTHTKIIKELIGCLKNILLRYDPVEMKRIKKEARNASDYSNSSPQIAPGIQSEMSSITPSLENAFYNDIITTNFAPPLLSAGIDYNRNGFQLEKEIKEEPTQANDSPPQLPPLKLRVKKEEKTYSDEDGNQVDGYIPIPSSVEENSEINGIPKFQDESQKSDQDWQQINRRLEMLNKTGPRSQMKEQTTTFPSKQVYSEEYYHNDRSKNYERREPPHQTGNRNNTVQPMTNFDWRAYDKRLEVLNRLGAPIQQPPQPLHQNYSHTLSGRVGTDDRQRKKRCKACKRCIAPDCGECKFCLDMLKHGGPGVLKQSCRRRACINPIVPNLKPKNEGNSMYSQKVMKAEWNSGKRTASQEMRCSDESDEMLSRQGSHSPPLENDRGSNITYIGDQHNSGYRQNILNRHNYSNTRYPNEERHKSYNGDRNRTFAERKEKAKKHHSSLWKASKKMYNSNFRAY